MRTKSGVMLGSKYLIPAPYVNSNYEYIKFGGYILGGVLNVVLDGTIASENIAQEIQNIASLSANTDCVKLIVGCDGSPDFLEGAGRITNVSVNASDSSPFTANYSITVSLETVNNKPAVEPDPDFLQLFGLSNVSFIKEYNEEITVEGDATVIGYVDNALTVSKSFIKASGSISVTSSTKIVCGVPSFNGIGQSIRLLKERYESLSSFSFNQSGHPLSRYAGWTRWLDSKSITIDESGKVSCSFDIYLTKGPCSPIARIDIRTEDKIDYKLNSSSPPIPNRTISGTINGLSTATNDLLQDKTTSNERLSNALVAYGGLEAFIKSGYWPGGVAELSGEEGECKPPECPPLPQTLHYERLSSNVNISKVAGEITFSAEFGPTSNCLLNNFDIETTVEEDFPVTRFREFIIPNSPNPVIQYIGDTPHKATVTAQGSIKNCDKTTKPKLISCVKSSFDKVSQPYLGWLKTSEQITESKFGYKIISAFINVVCN